MKFENTEVWGFAHAIRGMRNPMESWERSDSVFPPNGTPQLGKNDLELAQKLIRAGSEHRKFLRQIFVSTDMTAPLYLFKEFDTYKVGTVSNSCSTMHKLASTEITMNCFETDDRDSDLHTFPAEKVIEQLEKLRIIYLKTRDKRYWKELIRWLPESWLQKRTITMNYENLYTICHQRQNHKLNEWSGCDNPALPNFIAWARTLPYAEELIFTLPTA